MTTGPVISSVVPHYGTKEILASEWLLLWHVKDGGSWPINVNYLCPFHTGWRLPEDSANRHWSLVVAPSPRLVAIVRGTVSKCHGNEKIIFISATKWTVAPLSGIVETQLRRLICKKKHYSSLAERCECTTTMSQLSRNNGATNGDCKGEMASVRDNGATNNDAITTTPQRTFHPWLFSPSPA